VWVHAPSPLKVAQPVDRERLPLLCLPTPAVRVTATCNNKKNTQTTVRFNFSFLYRSAFLSLLLCFESASLFLLCSVSLFCPSSSNDWSGGCGRSIGSRRWGTGTAVVLWAPLCVLAAMEGWPARATVWRKSRGGRSGGPIWIRGGCCC